jgi:hypothetical protein
MLKATRSWACILACLVVLAACQPVKKFGRTSPVAIPSPDGSGVVFAAYPDCKDPTVTITDLSFDVDSKIVWETHLVDRSKGGARMIGIDNAPDGYSSATHDSVTLERVLSPNSNVVLYMHLIVSTGFKVNGTLSTSTTRKIDAESAVFSGEVVSRKELGC